MASHIPNYGLYVYIDLQAGDGGKGRLVLLHSMRRHPTAVIRYNGGPNAGHTLVFDDGTEFAAHQLPAGYFIGGCDAILEKGMVIEPYGLLEEIETARATGKPTGHLVINELAHVILPLYVSMDRRTDAADPERRRSTGRGIKQAYEAKYGRRGFRMQDLAWPTKSVMERLHGAFEAYAEGPGREDTGLDELESRTMGVVDAVAEIGKRASIEGPKLLGSYYYALFGQDSHHVAIAEGAQGAYLDVDDGEYPNTTSSSCGVAGTYTGTEVPHVVPRHVLGVMKPYFTRAGKGAVPSMIEEQDITQRIRERGHELGTTTGLPRDIGWLDFVQTDAAARRNWPEALALTKLDVLSGLDRIGVCVAYKQDGLEIDYPYGSERLASVEPEIEYMKGFGDIAGMREWDGLPEEARTLVEMIERRLHTPVIFIGTGPGTKDFITRDEGKHIFRPGQQ